MCVNETRRILADIVQREQARGATDEAIKGSEKELVEAASQGGKAEAEGAHFILQRIAELEKITVTQGGIASSASNAMAARYGMTAEKTAKELEKRDAMDRVAEEILSEQGA